MGVVGEIVVLTMLKDEDAAVVEELFCEDEVRNLWQLFQGVGWVGEDEIELLPARLDETEHITPDTFPGKVGADR